MIESALARVSATLRVAGHDLVIISDNADWALDDQAAGIARHLPVRLRPVIVSRVPHGVRGKTLHFFNRYAALERHDLERLAAANRLILTWTHGGALQDSSPELYALTKRFAEVGRHFARVHVSASLYRPIVIRSGIPPDRVRHIPFAIHTHRFRTELAVSDARSVYGLPQNGYVVGSFQRDGETEPKLVKGPDRLVELTAALRESIPNLHVLLTGPARGWICRALTARAIPFTYAGIVERDSIRIAYRACDIYPITAREEGGPLALLEAMAAGVPVVGFPVGMVPDVIRSGDDGILAADLEGLTRACLALASDRGLSERIVSAARASVERFDWRIVGPRYAAELYDA